MADSGLGEALRRLRELGFTPAQSRGDVRCFEGALTCKKGSVRVQLEVSDWDFVDYPTIRLLETPSFLPKVIPHVAASGGICYFMPGAAVLDRFHPGDALWQCIEQARKELDRLSEDSSYRQNEFQSEFGANWLLGQDPLPLPILLASATAVNGQVPCFVVDDARGAYYVIASERDEVAGLCAVRGWPPPRMAPTTCWIVRSERMPALPSNGFPRTVGDMFDWIKGWDRAAFGAMQGVLGNRVYLEQPFTLFVVHCPAGWFGFSIAIDGTKRLAYKRKPRNCRQYFHGRGRSHPLVRMSIAEIGTDYVHSRNLTFPSLKDRVITLIGCGAIGGYLAQALAKLGAGAGSRGRLFLIDPQIFSADNAGRHLLGMDSLFKGKVAALKKMLNNQFPSLAIEVCPRDAALPKDLNGDLVIDATGEESLGEAINFHRLSLPAVRRPPILHVWVEGNGECVQGLWVDSAKHACYRCLRLPDSARTKRFSLLRAPATERVIGCRAFTPYAVSAPMSAAALAVDMVISWLNGNPSPRFRTRAIEGADVRKIKSQDLTPLEDCAACSGRS